MARRLRAGADTKILSGEPLDDLHGPATVGTAIKLCSIFGRGGVFFGQVAVGCAQQLKEELRRRLACGAKNGSGISNFESVGPNAAERAGSAGAAAD